MGKPDHLVTLAVSGLALPGSSEDTSGSGLGCEPPPFPLSYILELTENHPSLTVTTRHRRRTGSQTLRAGLTCVLEKPMLRQAWQIWLTKSEQVVVFTCKTSHNVSSPNVGYEAPRRKYRMPCFPNLFSCGTRPAEHTHGSLREILYGPLRDSLKQIDLKHQSSWYSLIQKFPLSLHLRRLQRWVAHPRRVLGILSVILLRMWEESVQGTEGHFSGKS